MSNTEYDLIFVGGGTTGCLIAGRLAAADPSLNILVLEAGPTTKNIDKHIQPGQYPSHLAPTSTTLKFHVGKPSKELGGRALVTPTGHCIGGGSSINFMVYTRGAQSDYDNWETLYENRGWGTRDLLPLLKKTESYQVAPDKPSHGYKGPLKVSYGGAYTNVAQQFLKVAAEFDKQRGSTDDPNNLSECDSYARWPKWIDGETGRRSDVPHHFIYNQEHNRNLQVLSGTTVKRIIFEDLRAVGVEYVENANTRNVHFARASKLVVISAGAFGSPMVLERSGIGAKHILEKFGLEQVVDLPGVGENYQDHNAASVPCCASDDAETLDALFRGEKDEVEKCISEWNKDHKGYLASNGFDAGIKMRPTAEDLKELGPDFEKHWSDFFANAPDKPVLYMAPISANLAGLGTTTAGKYFIIGFFLLYPLARGYVHITSADDAQAPSDFDPGFIHDVADLVTLRWAYKKAREIARRLDVYRGEWLPGNPQFKEGSAAACNGAIGPISLSAANIIYTPEDDDAIDKWIRDWVQTAWHSIGTCGMKPREQGGVVDSRLNVYGVHGLKIADCSICPSNVGANTYSTALVIGEKAALIIAEELGIKGV